MNANKALEYLDEPSDEETANEISESSDDDAFAFKNKNDYDVTLKLSSSSDENEASSTSETRATYTSSLANEKVKSNQAYQRFRLVNAIGYEQDESTQAKSPLRQATDSGVRKQQNKPVASTSSITFTRITRSQTVKQPVKTTCESGADKRSKPFTNSKVQVVDDSSEEADDEKDPDYNKKNDKSSSSDELNEIQSNSDDEIVKGKKKDGQPGYQWSKTPTGSFANVFTETSGITKKVEKCRSLLDFFSYILNTAMIDHIIYNTNARIRNSKNKAINHPLTVIEFQCFTGLLLLFGVLRKNKIEIDEIWATAKNSLHNVQYATAAMSRDRFKLIIASLVFDDLDTREIRKIADPKYFKFALIFENFKKNITSAFTPGKHLVIDETLYSFRGRCGHRQYMPAKPAKYGLKYFCIVDVNTSYLLDCNPYKGMINKVREVGCGSKAVIRLCTNFFGSNRNVTMDNYFTSIPLSDQLAENGLTLIGTIRANKSEIPPSFLKGKSREILSTLACFKDNKTLISYVPKKNKAVILLSTYHHENKIIDNEKKQKKSEIILDYNKNKGGVDTLDHLLEVYSCRRKTNKWTTNTFFYLLDVAAYNALVLFRMQYPKECEELYGKDKRCRRFSIESLAIALIKPQIEFRIKKFALINFKHIHNDIIDSFRNLGFDDLLKVKDSNEAIQLKRCGLCQYNKNMKKEKNSCSDCDRYFCSEHGTIVKKCSECVDI